MRRKFSLGRVQKYHKYWLTAAFFFGFLIDNITLNRVDQVFDNIVLAGYVVLASLSLIVLYAATAGKFVPERYRDRIRQFAPLAVQFAFGGLLSGILIFYGRSGSWYASWPFLLLILGVIVSNEMMKNRAQRLIFNLTILFIGLFSYVVLIVPVISGKMGSWIFLLSGLIAILVMYGFVRLLLLVVPNFLRANMRMVVFSLGLIYISLNFLYFTNIIPPIPLSLKDMGIYHQVVRLQSGDYHLTYEQGDWYQIFKNSDKIYHYQGGDDVYCFASVFAPTKLSTTIYHRWDHYDPDAKEWRQHGRFSYDISGGRDGGFRGYTRIASVTEGTWRCTVETERGQVLGREVFKIERGMPLRGLVTRTN